MNTRKKRVNPIPDEFASYEEAPAFWDTHDTTDYPGAFQGVNVQAEFRGRHYEVEIDEDVIVALREQAQKRGVTVSRLVSDLLRQQISPAT